MMKQDFFDEQFELASRPAAWAMQGRRLKRSADLIFAAWRRDVEDLELAHPALLPNLDLGPGSMLLFGLAFENVVKGLVVEGNPKLVANGSVRKWPGGGSDGHNLSGLCKNAGIGLDAEQKDIIDRLSAFVRWAGKYPVPWTATRMGMIQRKVLSGASRPLSLSPAEVGVFSSLFDSLEGRLITYQSRPEEELFDRRLRTHC